MSNLIQTSVPANAGVQSSKISMESADSSASNDGSSDFTTALASLESEVQSKEQQLLENSPELITESRIDGNSLPAEESAELWQNLMLIQPESPADGQPVLLQASMLLQPAENIPVNSVSPQSQSISLLESKNKPFISPEMYKQDYFNLLSMQNKSAAAFLPAGFSPNDINMQLAATHFMPEKNEALLFNMTEQLQPAPSINTTLSQSLAAVGLGTTTQAAATQTQMAPLNLSQNAWEANLGSRLQMMIGQNVQAAEIRLDPPELGTLDIKIKITNDVASVNITSAHTQVREALETAVPRLREMFAESGVSLGDVNVHQESFAQQENSEEEQANYGQSTELDQDEELMTSSRKIVSDSLLDIYA